MTKAMRLGEKAYCFLNVINAGTSAALSVLGKQRNKELDR